MNTPSPSRQASGATVAEKLIEARKLIERGWCKHTGARDVNGNPCWGGDASTVAWCSVAALCTVTPEEYLGLSRTLREAIGLTPERSISAWNDAPERTQADVLAAFDKAIELARVSA